MNDKAVRLCDLFSLANTLGTVLKLELEDKSINKSKDTHQNKNLGTLKS